MYLTGRPSSLVGAQLVITCVEQQNFGETQTGEELHIPMLGRLGCGSTLLLATGILVSGTGDMSLRQPPVLQLDGSHPHLKRCRQSTLWHRQSESTLKAMQQSTGSVTRATH